MSLVIKGLVVPQRELTAGVASNKPATVGHPLPTTHNNETDKEGKKTPQRSQGNTYYSQLINTAITDTVSRGGAFELRRVLLFCASGSRASSSRQKSETTKTKLHVTTTMHATRCGTTVTQFTGQRRRLFSWSWHRRVQKEDAGFTRFSGAPGGVSHRMYDECGCIITASR